MEMRFRWWPIFVYLLLILVFLLLLYIPIVIALPDLFENSDITYQEFSDNHFWFPLLNQFAFTLAVLFATVVSIRSIEERKLSDYALTFDQRSLAMGFTIGSVLMALFVLLFYSFGFFSFSYNEVSTTLLTSFTLFFLVSLCDEVMIRGYILFKLREKIGNTASLLITSILFGLMHLANDHVTCLGVLNISLSGFLMGLLILKTNSISSAIGVHWAWNFVQGPVFGFGVSGRAQDGIVKPLPQAEALFTGGSFGIEGSVLLIPISVLFIFLLYKYRFFLPQRNQLL